MPQPKKFGPFILNRLIGRGGMGAVYQATNETTGQTVAVKALLVPLEEERERFEAEISTLKLLRHENIVKLYGFGQEDGVLYYAMEFVPGPSLATLLKRGRRFTWEEVVYIGVSVCKALKHAHDRGVVHRDVKPANILLLDDGVVKVSDYGIAQYFGNSRLTGANQVVGTIEYMAPEQAQAGPLTPRTDVYALGALLYALLTGAPPYVARSLPELLQRYRQGLPESIRYARPEAPKILDAVLMDLLQIIPDKRPSDARLVGRRLEGVLRTASSCPDGNPFWRQRFTIDGRSSTDSFPNSRVDLETPSGFESVEDAKRSEIVVEGTPDFPYRAIADEEEADAASNPFEKTTEVGSSVADSADDVLKGPHSSDVASKNATKNDSGFDLGDFSLNGETLSSSSSVGLDETVSFQRNESAATATAPLDDVSQIDADNDFKLTDVEISVPNDLNASDESNVELNVEANLSAPEMDSTRAFNPNEKSAQNDVELELAERSQGADAGRRSPTPSLAENSNDAKRSFARQATDFELATENGSADSLDKKNAKTPANADAPTVAYGPTAFLGAGKLSAETSALESEALENTVYQTPDEYFGARQKPNETDVSERLEATPLEKFKRSQFTPVDEKELGKLPTREDERSPYFIVVQSAVAIIVFSLIFVFFWSVFRTPSADSIFQRIEKTVESGDDDEKPIVALRRAENDLTRFLEIYPNDVRAEQVRYYLSELDIDKFEQRIERQLQRNERDGSALPVERAYWDAARAAKNDLDKGVVKLAAFVDLFGAEPRDPQTANEEPRQVDAKIETENKTDDDVSERPTDEDAYRDNSSEKKTNDAKEIPVSLTDQLVVVARRRLERLQEERAKTRRADLQLLNDRLNAAISIRKTNPERAEKMKEALFELYGDRSWAQNVLNRARHWDEIAPNEENNASPPEESASRTKETVAETPEATSEN